MEWEYEHSKALHPHLTGAPGPVSLRGSPTGVSASQHMWSPGLSPSLGGWPSPADPLEADNQSGSTSVQLQKPRPVLAESCAVAAYEAGVPVSGPKPQEPSADSSFPGPAGTVATLQKRCCCHALGP